MELRKAEDEIQSISSLYSSLCQSEYAELKNLKLPPLLNPTASSDFAPFDGTQSAANVIKVLDSLRERLDVFHGIAEKFRRRLAERDPVTEKPRYGEQTSKRVGVILERYQDVCRAVGLVFGDSSATADDAYINDEDTSINPPVTEAAAVDAIRQAAAIEIEWERKRQEEERLQSVAEEDVRLADIELTRREQAEAAEASARLEREAEETRARERARARQAIQLAQAQATAADRAWVQSIPNRRSLQGVSEQLQIFARSSDMDSLTALHTIFSQITAHPEEVNFRRIRRDHPRFEHDIGQYAGGKELLLAAGFELGFVEEVPSYVCKEPDVEKDLDGWSAWFDLLKGTSKLIEAQMMK